MSAACPQTGKGTLSRSQLAPLTWAAGGWTSGVKDGPVVLSVAGLGDSRGRSKDVGCVGLLTGSVWRGSALPRSGWCRRCEGVPCAGAWWASSRRPDLLSAAGAASWLRIELVAALARGLRCTVNALAGWHHKSATRPARACERPVPRRRERPVPRRRERPVPRRRQCALPRRARAGGARALDQARVLEGVWPAWS